MIISEFLPGSNATAIQITEDAVVYMQNLGFTVHRTPDQNASHPQGGSNCHYTYTNAFRVNDRIFISSYADGDPTFLPYDQQALAAWQAAAPNCQIIQIPCYGIIWAAGAIHCITMQVPRYTDPRPTAHVIAPAGGELLVSGYRRDIEWASSDDVKVTSVDLFSFRRRRPHLPPTSSPRARPMTDSSAGPCPRRRSTTPR